MSNKDSILKKDLNKADQQAFIQNYLLDSFATAFGKVAIKQNNKMDAAVKEAAEILIKAIPNPKGSPLAQTLIIDILDDTNSIFSGLGYTLTDLKTATASIGMPPELYSTEDGKEFLTDYYSGNFKHNNIVDYSVMTEQEIKHHKTLKEWQKLNKGQDSRKGGPISKFIQNLFYNALPEKWDQHIKAGKIQERKTEEIIDALIEYDTLVERGIEKDLIDHWRAPIRSSKTKSGTKDSIKRRIELYNSLSQFEKIIYLKEFEVQVTNDYDYFVKTKVEATWLKLMTDDIEAKNPLSERKQHQKDTYLNTTTTKYQKWMSLKKFTDAQNIASSFDFQKNIENFNKGQANKLELKNQKSTTRKKKNPEEVKRQMEQKRKAAAKARLLDSI